MKWLELSAPAIVPLLALLIGYFLGARRDRLSAVRTKQIEALTELYEKILEIEQQELSDGKQFRMAVSVQGGKRPRSGLLDGDETRYQEQLSVWRQALYHEANRAELWIDHTTLGLVRAYFLIMMECMHWEENGRGLLVEHDQFLSNLRLIFGSTRGVLKKVEIRGSFGEPWMLNCSLLSDLCLHVIQRRIFLEISSPFRFWVAKMWWRLKLTIGRLMN